jgi:aminoglycoside 6'-N-acetyltransferase I
VTHPFQIRAAVPDDIPAIARQRALLWPDGSLEEHTTDASRTVGGHPASTLPLAILVAEIDGRPVGFVEVGLRSHADGCNGERPVGFIEGWYVDAPFRRRGIGRALVGAAEAWARAEGCDELASDTWLDNEASQRAHEALGFQEVDRCVNYKKALR